MDGTADEGTLDSIDDLLWLIHEMPETPSTPKGIADDCARRGIAVEAVVLARLMLEGQAEGLVDIWDDEGGETWVTLTPLAAEKLDVRLTFRSDRWISRKIDEPPLKFGHEEFEESMPEMGSMFASKYRPGDEHRPSKRDQVNPATYTDNSLPEPLGALADSDRGDLIGPSNWRLLDRSFVRIIRVHGLGTTWTGQTFMPLIEIDAGNSVVKRVCRGCGCDACDPRSRLARNACCVVCDRLGVDGNLPPVEADLLPATEAKKRKPTEDKNGRLRGGKGGGVDAQQAQSRKAKDGKRSKRGAVA